MGTPPQRDDLQDELSRRVDLPRRVDSLSDPQLATALHVRSCYMFKPQSLSRR